jgi:hypothetical protein
MSPCHFKRDFGSSSHQLCPSWPAMPCPRLSGCIRADHPEDRCIVHDRVRQDRGHCLCDVLTVQTDRPIAVYQGNLHFGAYRRTLYAACSGQSLPLFWRFQRNGLEHSGFGQTMQPGCSTDKRNRLTVISSPQCGQIQLALSRLFRLDFIMDLPPATIARSLPTPAARIRRCL